MERSDVDTILLTKQSLLFAGNYILQHTRRAHRRALVNEANLAAYVSRLAEHVYSDLAYRLAGSDDAAVELLQQAAEQEKAEAASKEVGEETAMDTEPSIAGADA